MLWYNFNKKYQNNKIRCSEWKWSDDFIFESEETCLVSTMMAVLIYVRGYTLVSSPNILIIIVNWIYIYTNIVHLFDQPFL